MGMRTQTQILQKFKNCMDPNLNRNSMGSRAGTALKPKFGAGGVGAPSRQGTAGKGLNPLGGVGSTVTVHERPITTGGGIHSSQGVKMERQVYDKNYYINKMKEKLMSIQEETEALRKKTEQINKEQQLYNKLESRRDELVEEVRNLEGTLADWNITLDKLRINTRPEDVKYAYSHVKSQNEKLKSELDDIFIERKKIEQETESMRNQLTSIHQQMQLRLNQLDPAQRNQYQRLIAENNELMSEYSKKQAAMEELLGKLANAENRLRMDNQKLKGQLLKDQIQDLETKKMDYEIQLNEAGLSIPEARDRILARMKEDNQAIVNMEKSIKDSKKNIDIYEKRLRELQTALEDKKTEEEDKKKYEILYKKDKEMDDFLNSFDQIREDQLQELSSVEQLIVEALEKNSKVLEIAGQLPTRENLSINRADRSQNTLAQAKTEYEVRANNLRALQNAQKRTLQETSDLQNNIQKMKEQINTKFNKVEEIKDELNRKRSTLTREEEQLNSLKIKIEPNSNTSDYETNITEKKYQMQDNYGTYTGSERKLQQTESQLYYLRHYINTKSKDINFEDIKNECMSVAEELNKVLLN